VLGERGMPFEVQIRTEDMHRIAEEGIAAHWKYKEGRVGADRDEQYFNWLRRLLELQQEVRDPQEFMQNLRIELYPEAVYIFTPKGEVKSLPRGSTPVDFAYSIHTDVGHQCVGARVNGRMVPLRSRLNNGDIVEIVTQAGHTPSRDWLNFVATSRARHKIRHFIHGEEKSRSVELGRRLFDKELRRFTIDRALVSDEAIARVAGEFSASRVDDVFAGIGYGKTTARAVLAKLVGQEGLRERPSDQAAPPPHRRPGGAVDDQKIKVRGVDDLMVFRARCCNPIRGESIVGYVTRGKGVSVHAATCSNVVNLMFDPDRRIDVEWDTGQDTPYTVRLRISVEDRRGILADISSRIADIDTNIKDVEATVGVDQRGSIRMTVEISDLKHLERVMRSIRSVDGVLAVERATR
jgi:GTP pyrophosphokinase